MLLMNAIIGVNGIVWATPLADLGAMIIAIAMFIPFSKQIQRAADIPSWNR